MLLDWVRYYFSLIVLIALVGLAGAASYAALAPVRVEAWSIIVQSGSRISSLELGPVAQAIFRTESVYGPAMRELGIAEPPERFLDERANLRPVPETNALIVIGRSGDAEEATRISEAMMRSLIRVFRERDLADFTLFNRAAPAHADLSSSVAVALGAVAGFWLGVAVALLHYRWRRPLLSLQRAVRVSEPSSVTTVLGRRPRWLGVLRGTHLWKDNPRNRAALKRLATRWPNGEAPMVSVAGGRREEDALRLSLRESLQLPNGDGSGRAARSGVIVAHSGSGESSVARARRQAADLEQARIDLVWVH